MQSSGRGSNDLVPASILIGCALIGLGLYFGLRAGRPAKAPASDDVSELLGTEAPKRDIPAKARAPAARAPAADAQAPGMKAKVMEQAIQALERERPQFVKRCWEPALKEKPEPSKAKFLFNMSFDGATGREISRGISETREYPRSDVAQCLRALPMNLSVDPPGANVNIEVFFSFPADLK